MKKHQMLIRLNSIKKALTEVEDELYLNSKTKKTTGSYYTPDFIVDYMVKQVIERVVLSKLSCFISSNQRLNKLDELWLKNDLDLIKILYERVLPSLSICDISVGWGVFLLKAFDVLLNLYKKSLQKLNGNFNTEINEIVKDIVQLNLYGADISCTAVKLARLKLYEKIFSVVNKEELVLPKLGIVEGNSLVGTDFTTKNFQSKSLLDNYYSEYCNNLLTDDVDISDLLCQTKVIHWGKTFPRIKKQKGFDILIGNPPYINVKKLDKKARILYRSLYKTYNSNGDISNVFWERALNLAKHGGVVSYITPRYWLEGSDSDSLRQYLLKNSSLNEIIDFRSNRSLFKKTEASLGVDTLIMTITKSSNFDGTFSIYILNSTKQLNSINKNNFKRNDIKQNSLTKSKWNFNLPPSLKYIEENCSFKLGDDKKNQTFSGICEIGKGCSTGNNRIFKLKKMSNGFFEGYENKILNLPRDEHTALRKLIKNSDIKNYHLAERNQYWIFLKNKDIKEFPVIESYLRCFLPRLERTKQKYKLENYYDYAAYRSLSLIDHYPKIVTPYQSKTNRFALIKDSVIPTINETDVITLIIKQQYRSKIDWYYLIAILNSAVVHYYVSHKNKKIYYLYDFRTNQICGIPIPSTNNQGPIIKICKLLFFSHENEKINNVIYSLLCNLLNYMVFELYFRDIIGSRLIEAIEPFTLKVDLVPIDNQLSFLRKLEEILQNKTVKKNINLINSSKEFKEIKENSYLLKHELL